MTLTKSELKELMGKCEKATPGPWSTSPNCDGFTTAIRDSADRFSIGNIQGKADSDFIASANPAVVKSLCERLIGMQNALEDVANNEYMLAETAGLDAKEALEKWGLK